MDESPEKTKTRLAGSGARRRWRKWQVVIPALMLIVTVGLSGATVLLGARAVARLRERAREENRLHLESCLEHVHDYFDAVYSTLLFISLDKDVAALRTDSRDYIQRLYDHRWEHHRLTEIYVVERDFQGNRAPLMTFERGTGEQRVEEIHSLEREQDEYQELQTQIRGFATRPSALALLSRELPLCTPDASGGQTRGFVYSVPIRRGVELRGIVSGMFATATLHEVLRRGCGPHLAFLVNARGESIGDQGVPEEAHSELAARLRSVGAARSFAQAPESFPIGRSIALCKPAPLAAGEAWWLVLIPDPDAYLEHGRLGGMKWWLGLAACGLIAGIALTLLVRTIGQRLEEQVQHLEARKELEREVQRVSEREQRRIGEQLHEDLCQRLAGIEAVSKVLGKKLGARKLPEADIAAEIAREMNESLIRAREMADALQPVPLLQHGLLAALEVLASTTQARAGVPCRVAAADASEVEDASVATHLYRIAQEAVANAVRHAHPHQVVIGLSVTDTWIRLTVADDGRGLAPGAGNGAGMGIRVMRYRSDLMGGEVEIRPGDEGGTLVLCSVPRAQGGASEGGWQSS